MAKGGLKGFMRRARGGWIGGAASEAAPAAPPLADASAWKLAEPSPEVVEHVYAKLRESSDTNNLPAKRKASISGTGSRKRQHIIG